MVRKIYIKQQITVETELIESINLDEETKIQEDASSFVIDPIFEVHSPNF